MVGFSGSTGVSKKYVDDAIQQSTADMTVKTSVGWTTTISWTQNNNLSMLMIGNYYLVIVWGASTTAVNVLVITSSGTYNKFGTDNIVKFGNDSTDERYVITRSGNTMTLTCPSNQSIKVLT